ncbi:MAG: hypothetical protein H7841_14925 [Magnetospirillum sp. WYHS-4]
MADDGRRKWVWVSDPDSYAGGVPSVLAAFEVAFALWLYWWAIPRYFETDIHLRISVLVAPLLLLRSPASVQAALAAFERYDKAEEDSLRSPLAWAAIGLGGLAGAMAAGLLAHGWLPGHQGWDLFWRAAVVGWAGLEVAVAVAGGVVMAGPRHYVASTPKPAIGTAPP